MLEKFLNLGQLLSKEQLQRINGGAWSRKWVCEGGYVVDTEHFPEHGNDDGSVQCSWQYVWEG
ncbi:hypothetical protein [Ascidiimonas aurantiaca]|uniref:hypothetical protein n=1 Tax=Ascidiimonas aurantiaca TaxID=1685432 RepID=UPI0030EF8AFA